MPACETPFSSLSATRTAPLHRRDGQAQARHRAGGSVVARQARAMAPAASIEGLFGLGVACEWQAEAELRTAPIPRRRPDAAAHRLDQSPAHVEADPGAGRLPGGIRRAVEEPEQ